MSFTKLDRAPTRPELRRLVNRAEWTDHGHRYPYGRRLGNVYVNLAGRPWDAGCVFVRRLWHPLGTKCEARALVALIERGGRPRWYTARLCSWREGRI